MTTDTVGGTAWDGTVIPNTGTSVSNSGGTRAITGGTMKVYHNVLRYSAAVTFTGVQWTSSSCCYPTAGSISTTLTGSVTGTSTLSFSTTCGSATFVDTSGTSSTVTLNQCN